MLASCYFIFHADAVLAQNAAPPASGATQFDPKPSAQRTGNLGATADELLRGQSKVDVNAGTVTIITNRVLGGPIMTSILDLSALLDAGERFEKMRVIPMVARGKMQNLWDILYLRGVDMGFVQTDSLEYLKDDPSINSIRERLRYIALMFPEEIHIIARSDIGSLEDLAGKKVGINAKGTGSSLTGPIILRRLGIDAHVEYEDANIALERMRTGDLAATVYVLGKPAVPVAQIKGAGFHILPIPYARFQDLYLPSTFTSKEYPNLIPEGEEVQTIAVGNLLAVYNWPEGSERYKKVARFTDAFFSRFSELLKPGFHPAWKQVNLAATVQGWKRFKPAQEWIDAYTKDPLRTQFDAFLKQKGISGDSKTMFEDFLGWRTRSGNNSE